MMWTFMIACLATGTRAIVYDGSPFYPDTVHGLSLNSSATRGLPPYLSALNFPSVSGLGTSPRFLAEVQGQGINPRTKSGLSYPSIQYLSHTVELASFESLKVLMVNGAVLTKPLFKWAQRAFGERVHIMSTCGGTDVCTACEWVEMYPVSFC
jgi:acetoacetyl-CoA synthetase